MSPQSGLLSLLCDQPRMSATIRAHCVTRRTMAEPQISHHSCLSKSCVEHAIGGSRRTAKCHLRRVEVSPVPHGSARGAVKALYRCGPFARQYLDAVAEP